MRDYPESVTPPSEIQPAPRRVRAYLGGRAVLDTTGALYVWERPSYPHYYVPVADVDAQVLGDLVDTGAARVHGPEAPPGLVGTVRIDWSAVDAWFEEDEQLVGGHPRSPYTRVDALRSSRRVRIEVDGVVLAESSSPVLVFETGLPTRCYMSPTDVHHEHLVPSPTRTACPYKGWTSAYWSAVVGGETHEDIAWSYGFPMRELLPIAGLVAFYDERVDTWVDGALRERPVSPFSRRTP